MRLLTGLLLLIMVACIFSSCKPDDEKLNMSPSIRLSFTRYEQACDCMVPADTIMFDTVFVQTGSVTKRFWVHNKDRNAVNIERIELARASGSQYSLFINGQETNSATNIRLRGDDSLQILVKVLIDPNDQSQPFLITDSIRFITNGNLQDVDLVAFGQNAYFHYHSYDSIVFAQGCPNVTWLADKPHVVYGIVGVPQNCTLTVQEGARVFVHAHSGIIVGGTLILDGKANKRVTFQGDRREERFTNRPGQWLGIIFAQDLETTSIFRYADIKNAIYGVYIGSPGGNNAFDLIMEQCSIRNMLAYGLAAFNSKVQAINCLFSNAGEAAVGTFIGGTYEFVHCTIANYGGFFIHDKPTARFETRTKLSNGLFEEAPLDLGIYNSIIWGSFPNEVALVGGSPGTPTDYHFQNNMVRTIAHKALFESAGGLVSELVDFPKFVAPMQGNFLPDSTASSPAINAGATPFVQVPVDLRGEQRPQDNVFDIGAYEVTLP